ncbi:MAG TPA: septum formation family protein [Acidimicrobiales bacterium]|nr:septum formation family protein [Acidimicrobiales bacterium]
MANRGSKRAATTTGLALLAALSAACGGHSSAASGTNVPVFQLRPAECLNPPKANPNLAVSQVTVLNCSRPHYDEVYCVVPYSQHVPTGPSACPSRPPQLAGDLTENYPGQQALSKFADAVCLNEFEPYVGMPFSASSLYYTYIYPSPASWDDAVKRDRTVVCVLHATAPLTRSAKGAKL